MARARKLFEVDRPADIGFVRIGGADHPIVAPRVKTYARFMRLARELESDKSAGGDAGGEYLDRQQAAIVSMIEIAIPTLERAIIEEIEIVTAQKIVNIIAEAFNARAAATEAEARADPFPPSSSASPASTAST